MRSKLKLFLAALIVVAVTGAAQADQPKVVILNGWWLVAYAKNACNTGMFQPEDITVACRLRDPKQQAYEFGMAIRNEFATSQLCAGLIFGSYGSGMEAVSPEVSKALQEPHWFLMVSFVPGLKEHGWSLNLWPPSQSQNNIQVEGNGVAKDIVQKVCAVVQGRGGKILN